METERAAAEEAEARAREAAESGRAPPGAAGSKAGEAAALAEQEYLALESRLMVELGLVAGGEDGG